MLFCAGRNETFSFATPIGVGLIEVAMNLSEYVIKNSVDEIVFIGSGGLYKKGEIFDIIESNSCGNIEISTLLDMSYTPLDCIIKNVSYETLQINSSNFITKNFDIAHKFFDAGFYMENMEFYSILSVAKKFNIRAKGIFIATNFCNEEAHIDFIKNHKIAKERLIKYLDDKGLI